MNITDITNWISQHLTRIQRTLDKGNTFCHKAGWRVVKQLTPGLVTIKVNGQSYPASIEGGQVELGWI